MSRRNLLQLARPLFAASLCSLLVACSEPSPVAGLSPEDIALPIETTVRDIENRPLQIRLHYREKDSIHFTRLSDGREFDLPIARLSSSDRRWILKLPVSTPASRAKMRRNAQTAAIIERLKEDIAELDAEIQQISDEIGTGNLSNSHVRTRNKEVYKKRMEIQDLHTKIREHEASMQ